MSDQQNSAFGKFIPGFDFLQSLAKGASQAMPQMPNLSNWVAPTLNLDELEKRIAELKAVRFWLDQNSAALAATIQALEVQKMTLATLKGMNFNMAEVADALKLKPATDMSRHAGMPDGAGQAGATGHGAKSGAQRKARPAKEAAPAQVVDPLQWWGALTQQFQQIAATAMKDAAAAGTTTTPVGEAAASNTPARASGARKAPPRTKRAARKTAAG